MTSIARAAGMSEEEDADNSLDEPAVEQSNGMLAAQATQLGELRVPTENTRCSR